MYVVDSGNHRVIKYVPTDEELNRGKEERERAQLVSEYPAPGNLAIKPGDTETFLSWLDVPKAVSYNLYFHTSPNVTQRGGTKMRA